MRLRLLALPLVASLAWCQALDQAKRAFDSGDYAAAARLFEQAQMSSPSCEIHFFLGLDRKSTRLNSSHSQISYAVFCLKKHTPLRVRSGLDEEYSSDEIAKMTLLYEGTLSNIEEGEIVKSRVLRVTDTAVILDVGIKSEGAVAIDEFKDPKSLKEGDEIEVFLEHLED